MNIKGLKDIKTLRNVSSSRPTPQERSIGQLRFGPGTQNQQIERFQPKTWVFTKDPKFERFQKSLLVDKIQEPYVNIFEEPKSVVVIADLPGVTEEDITLKSVNDILLITATADTINGKKKYSTEVLIPFDIESKKTQSTFKNGILEVTLYRKMEKNKRRKNKNA